MDYRKLRDGFDGLRTNAQHTIDQFRDKVADVDRPLSGVLLNVDDVMMAVARITVYDRIIGWCDVVLAGNVPIDPEKGETVDDRFRRVVEQEAWPQIVVGSRTTSVTAQHMTACRGQAWAEVYEMLYTDRTLSFWVHEARAGTTEGIPS